MVSNYMLSSLRLHMQCFCILPAVATGEQDMTKLSTLELHELTQVCSSTLTIYVPDHIQSESFIILATPR